MEEPKVFRVINRINAILFLILLLGGIWVVLFFTIQANNWSNRGAVQVAENPKDKNSPKIELVLGSVNELEGHESQYVELRSKYRGGKLSSGYGGGEIRNVLFLVGEDLKSSWLFDKNTQFIKRVIPIKKHDSEESSSEVITILYEFVEEDSNNNQMLDKDDLFSIALTNPDGSGFLTLETGVSSVIDRTLSKNGSNLAILLQKKGVVYLRSYDPKTFELKGSARILEVGNGS
jgi:hypothetical protein